MLKFLEYYTIRHSPPRILPSLLRNTLYLVHSFARTQENEGFIAWKREGVAGEKMMLKRPVSKYLKESVIL